MQALSIHSEKGIVERAASGHARSFDKLVERYYEGVFGYAYRILRNRDDAADAAQTTFVKAHRSLAEFDRSRPFRPWLYRICGNVCIDISRGKHRGHEDLEKHAYMLESSSKPHESAEDSELRRCILKAVQRLPERYRRIVMLRHYEQLDVEEIAVKVGAPEGTIKSWLFRARALLRSELAGLVESGMHLEEAAA